jgi:hypothetical protein
LAEVGEDLIGVALSKREGRLAVAVGFALVVDDAEVETSDCDCDAVRDWADGVEGVEATEEGILNSAIEPVNSADGVSTVNSQWLFSHTSSEISPAPNHLILTISSQKRHTSLR